MLSALLGNKIHLSRRNDNSMLASYHLRCASVMVTNLDDTSKDLEQSVKYDLIIYAIENSRRLALTIN